MHTHEEFIRESQKLERIRQEVEARQAQLKAAEIERLRRQALEGAQAQCVFILDFRV